MTRSRSDRFHLGHRAEGWAKWYLTAKFYRLKTMRYKTPVGEIDLVLTRGHTIVFCEVKARDTLANGLFAITPQAQRRIARAAEHFCQRHPQYRNYSWRFDAIVVRPWRLPYHLRDAWRI